MSIRATTLGWYPHDGTHMKYTHHVHTWHTHTIHTLGTHDTHMIYTWGLHTWYAHMIYTRHTHMTYTRSFTPDTSFFPTWYVLYTHAIYTGAHMIYTRDIHTWYVLFPHMIRAVFDTDEKHSPTWYTHSISTRDIQFVRYPHDIRSLPTWYTFTFARRKTRKKVIWVYHAQVSSGAQVMWGTLYITWGTFFITWGYIMWVTYIVCVYHVGNSWILNITWDVYHVGSVYPRDIQNFIYHVGISCGYTVYHVCQTQFIRCSVESVCQKLPQLAHIPHRRRVSWCMCFACVLLQNGLREQKCVCPIAFLHQGQKLPRCDGTYT